MKYGTIKSYIYYMVLLYYCMIISKIGDANKYIKKRGNNSDLFINSLTIDNRKGYRKVEKKKKFKVQVYNGMRIGQGYDIHQIKVKTENDDNKMNEIKEYNIQNFKTLTIGGVKINNIYVLSHSDGDIIYHALVDSILGGAGSYDLGTLFPDKSDKYKNKNSACFLRYARMLLFKKGYIIGNVDINIIAEVPKINNIRDEIIQNISQLLNISESQINVKGKTHEKLGVIGEKKAIECFANVLLIPKT
ncbi:2C-methyl-D-erythritol 2,4-cyclodiphosphate synthase, putative [Plasmodium berghei]|uniref:2-C-methyl-D-erythritol 2,4-cyclodiphosphate synthase n=2 Tax=Plasmodium berghei TaxID=5821 RepID=A0A509AD84_PLABA|nr:2C-methyl-D-erythritol 2,4-cyclodiphosphate synthase, putative [Plasmodium berghei ANKA]CXH93747.1 2C-methyl-D-erythritol 2,4-cyclodiphosphate synthase, putative [Plasmodium berghei]SCL90835.1 2C-methyl-D-erythritol 2,4-cyclodiphosphate synthase, putative [Plasmodium berghei]SCM15364.1 2C-methyl-D-erythritol 2,4-cyclodiphosphate synthase, putative [Plasmodium berghei]SCM17157.1 2C-methyl-D-erythritol 2,4-cyclodiphosphate synthase, putative [Plasmodium berghei]SCN22171.1 2C-methyl-D-erythrit|eukprot:XP_034419948.1 2C-methyl-D-erythritol 2,4-cyclodiphosphate synthase, putative [Plasmodium berghei ANKA]